VRILHDVVERDEAGDGELAHEVLLGVDGGLYPGFERRWAIST
jgi:hypothetical protein